MGIKINTPSRVFLAGPFTGMADKSGRLPEGYVRILRSLVDMLRRRGHFVFSSHELEQWGKLTKKITPEQLTLRDTQALKVADYLIIFLGFPGRRSTGTSMELGIATAQMWKGGRPKGIIFLRHKGDADKEIRAFEKKFKTMLKGKFDVVEFANPAEAISKLRERIPVIPKTKRFLRGRSLLMASRNLNKPRGATYFTVKPRKTPV